MSCTHAKLWGRSYRVDYLGSICEELQPKDGIDEHKNKADELHSKTITEKLRVSTCHGSD
jgi:hypothetical protein